MRTYFSFLFLIFFLGNNTSAQTDLSLAQAIEIGLKNNFQIQIADRNIEIAQRNNTWQATGRYPTINLNVASNNN